MLEDRETTGALNFSLFVEQKFKFEWPRSHHISPSKKLCYFECLPFGFPLVKIEIVDFIFQIDALTHATCPYKIKDFNPTFKILKKNRVYKIF